ncbi:MAG: hypothetical protein ACHQ50_06570, partial [Fimbriimonadales bacterium]
MIILDVPRKLQDKAHIRIPVYHLPHLAIDRGMQVQICLLPGEHKKSAVVPYVGSSQLIVSTFEFQQWDRLWRVNATFHDREGLVHDVCEVLRRLDINIVAAESSPIEEQGLYQVEVVFEEAEEDNVRLAEWCLLAMLGKVIAFLPSGAPNLRIRRLTNLWQAKRSYEKLRSLRPARSGHQLAFPPIIDKATVEEFEPVGGPRQLKLHLPDKIRRTIRSALTGKDEPQPDGNIGWHLRISDTKDRLLRILFFKSSDPVLYASLEHHDRTGAMADVCGALRAAGFSVLTSLHRPAETRSRTRLELVVRAEHLAGSASDAIKEVFEGAIAASSASLDLDIHVSYPDGYADKPESRAIVPVSGPSMSGSVADSEAKAESAQDSDSWIRSLYDDVLGKHRSLIKKINESMLTREEDRHWNLVNTLLAQFAKATRASSPKTVFISCQYSSGRLNKAREVAERLGFKVVSGERTERYPSQTSAIIAKVRSCTHFLGIWSVDRSFSTDKECWPSPWLLWELGVAETAGLDFRLLIDHTITQQAWRRIHGSPQQVLFSDVDFETQLAFVLEVLMSLGGEDLVQ